MSSQRTFGVQGEGQNSEWNSMRESAGPSASMHKRQDSEQTLAYENNPNVSWLESQGSWFFYIVMLALGRGLLSLAPMTSQNAHTVFHVVHCLCQYAAFHRNLGTPWVSQQGWGNFDQGKYDSMTFWDSIDRYPQHRRVLLTSLLLVFLLTINFDTFPPSLPRLAINTACLLLALVPKFNKRKAAKI